MDPYFSAIQFKNSTIERSLKNFQHNALRPNDKDKTRRRGSESPANEDLDLIDKNAARILNQASNRDKPWMRQVLSLRTPPEKIIEAVGHIQHANTQQAAWAFVAQNAKLKEAIRLKAAENIIDVSLKQTILNYLNKDVQTNLYKADKQHLAIALSNENTYEIRYAAAQAVRNSDKRDHAYCVIAQNSELSDHQRFEVSKQIHHSLLASEAFQKIILDMIATDEVLDLEELFVCIQAITVPQIKTKTIEALVQVAHRWMDLEDEERILEQFAKLQEGIPGDGQAIFVSLMVKNMNLSKSLRIEIVKNYIPDAHLQNTLIDAIEGDECIRLQSTKSAYKNSSEDM